MVELDHSFSNDKPADELWPALLDLERLVPLVQGGTVTEKVDDETVKAEILVKMGAMSMKFVGTVEVAEKDEDAHRALMKVKSRESKGSGTANADVTFELGDSGGTIHTKAQVTGKAATRGEGTVQVVLDALINDFTQKLATL